MLVSRSLTTLTTLSGAATRALALKGCGLKRASQCSTQFMYKQFKSEFSTSQAGKMAGSKLNVVLFLGSVREGRMGERVGLLMKKVLEDSNHHVELFDPLELNLPLVTKPYHFHKDPPNDAPKNLVELAKKIKAADAYVVVSAEYNRTIPPALSNTMDHFPPADYAYKPSAIVTYSPSTVGGICAAVALRPFLAELGCPSIPQMLNIAQVYAAIDEKGTALNEVWNTKAANIIKQLDWYANAMKQQRDKTGIPEMAPVPR